MRSKKALANIIASLVFRVTATVCGLLVLQLTIQTFGSAVNGLVNSIEQFLGFVVILESGIGGVVRAALYRPLANRDIRSVSRITKAAEQFYRIIAFISMAYTIGLAIFYPYLVTSDFSWSFTFSLILIIGITSFFRYYFALSYRILLAADQRKYVDTGFQTLGILVSTVVVIALIRLGASIQIVTLGSSLVYIVRPLVLNYYVKRRYGLETDCEPDQIALEQKWDAVGHHVAGIIHRKTDVVILTIFAPIVEVSVYAVYVSITGAIKATFGTFFSNLEAAFGDMIAKNERRVLERNFRVFEFMSFSMITVLFTSTAILIIPFVFAYTRGIHDANYIRPVFASVLILADAFSCLRVPYQTVAMAAGHYRQTRNGAFVEAGINIVLSLILVQYWGMVGVAIGTLCAMIFRTIQYVHYLSVNILKRSVWEFVRGFALYGTTSLAIVALIRILPLTSAGSIHSYSQWIPYAFTVTLIGIAMTSVTGMLFYRQQISDLLDILGRMLRIRKGKEEA